jgi:hypothetical protein
LLFNSFSTRPTTLAELEYIVWPLESFPGSDEGLEGSIAEGDGAR